MQSLVKNLQKLAKHRNYTGSTQFPSDQCWICERDLDENDVILYQSYQRKVPRFRTQ